MSRTLDILVPHYTETPEEVKPLLDSIALQQAVDFGEIGVIFCHDGEESQNLNFSGYPFEIRQIRQEHKGVSAARNACLDASSADYVMWCDADDMFYNMCGLSFIFKEIEEGGFNAFISIFIEETRDAKGKPIFTNHEMDFTFVHGKVYNRKYLIDNGIRWNEALTIHEDSYFNCLAAQKLTKEIKYCKQPFYLWKWRDTSVCRHDEKYILKTYNNMLDSNSALIEELLRRDRKADAQGFVCAMFYTAYFTMNKKEWLDQENQEYRYNTEKYFQRCYLKFKDLFDTASEEQKMQLIVSQKNRFFQQGVFFESVTFDDWIRHIAEMK